MLEAVDNQVVYLKRLRVGEWTLDGLEKWEWKYIEK
jgi:16S rRNA U516 pseudouridylate synthase RsuA-like enzyme